MESRFDRRELLFQPRGIPPLGTSLSLALQHLVAMIVGCVTPPIIIAGAIGLSQEEQVLLIQASLVMSAVCTFLQLYPIGGRFGSGLPVILGVSFAYVPSMQAIAASHLTARDVVLYFSYSGSTEELLKNLKIVWERKAKVILITRFPKSPGASYAHVVLQCGSKEGPLQVGSVAARVAQLYLTDVLFHEVCRRHPDQCAAIRQVVAEALSDKHI